MSAEEKNRTVLFVDDDPQFLATIERLMRLWSRDQWTVLTAPGASAALAILQKQQPNLIVLDVCMPVVDGLQFLSIVHRRYPEIQKVALTGFATEAYRTACLANGAELFLEKPRTSEGYDSIFQTFDELTKWKPEAGFRGVLRRVGLTEVIQMECLNKSSSILKVTAPGLVGAIYIADGAIIHAEAGELKGAEAVYKLFALAGGDFSLNPYVEPPERSIDMQWEFLLMEAAQRRDEVGPGDAAPEPEEQLPIAKQREVEEASDRVPVRIEEMMICSEAGDVLHSWECPETDLRINFLEFISQKARLLRNALPLGAFDRVEFSRPNARFVAQIGAGRGVIVRSALGPGAADNGARSTKSSAPSAPPSAAVRTQAATYFQETLKLPGALAAGLHFSDGSGSTQSLSNSFPPDALDVLRRSANDAFRVLKLQGFNASRARWSYEQAIVECALWQRGACLALAVSRQNFELDPHALDETLEAFLAAEPKT